MNMSGTTKTNTSLILSVIIMALSPQMVSAQDDDLSVDFDLNATSDYIYRGISRTGGDPAIQGSVEVSNDSGFYGRVFASSLDNGLGQDAETEFALGYFGSATNFDYELSVAYDKFWGGPNDKGYAEIRSSISRDMGFLYARTGLNYAPDNREFGGGSSLYGYGEIEVPFPINIGIPLSMNVRTGYEAFESIDNKWDWSVNLIAGINDFVISAGYHDVKGNTFFRGKSRFNLSVRYYF